MSRESFYEEYMGHEGGALNSGLLQRQDYLTATVSNKEKELGMSLPTAEPTLKQKALKGAKKAGAKKKKQNSNKK